jgi:hypothetical protein
LAVSASHNLRVWAFRRSLLEEPHGFVDSGGGGVVGKSVGSQISCVGWSDALAGYLAWFGGFQVVADCWASGDSLFVLALLLDSMQGSAYEETWLRGRAGENEGDGFAGAIAQFVSG